MTGLRAITVSVGYEDLLAVTLPYNRHHFDEVWIVTDAKSQPGVSKIAAPLDVGVLTTDLFTADGARFNKWRALEWGLDQMGRHGWLCVMDADVLWPRDVVVQEVEGKGNLFFKTPAGPGMPVLFGELMSPLRRMAPWPLKDLQFNPVTKESTPFELFDERVWDRHPVHRNVGEWAGYTQIFHADDPALGAPPWHEIDWIHGGGADSLFQRKWPNEKKRRPSWQVLHLGDAGANWYGRATALVDGTVPDGSEERRRLMADIWLGRRAIRQAGGTEADTFKPERIQPGKWNGQGS